MEGGRRWLGGADHGRRRRLDRHQQLTSPVIGFILDQKGLMYNLTLEGSKITRINP